MVAYVFTLSCGLLLLELCVIVRATAILNLIQSLDFDSNTFRVFFFFWFSCVALAVHVGLSCSVEPPSQSQVSCKLEQVFFWPVFDSIWSTMTSFSVHVLENHPHDTIVPPPCFTASMVFSG